jgi:hypothetical protein
MANRDGMHFPRVRVRESMTEGAPRAEYHHPMAELINLRMARKRKAREAAARRAAENRAKFGRTPAAKQRDAAAAGELRRKLEQLRRETPEKND